MVTWQMESLHYKFTSRWLFWSVHFDTFRPSTLILLDRSLRHFDSSEGPSTFSRMTVCFDPWPSTLVRQTVHFWMDRPLSRDCPLSPFWAVHFETNSSLSGKTEKGLSHAFWRYIRYQIPVYVWLGSLKYSANLDYFNTVFLYSILSTNRLFHYRVIVDRGSPG